MSLHQDAGGQKRRFSIVTELLALMVAAVMAAMAAVLGDFHYVLFPSGAGAYSRER